MVRLQEGGAEHDVGSNAFGSDFFIYPLIYKALVFEPCDVFFDKTALINEPCSSSGIIPYPARGVYIGQIYMDV